MGGYPAEGCHRLPFELSICPTCGAGIRPSRAWTWINAAKLFEPGCIDPEYKVGDPHCLHCVVCNPSLLISQKEFKPNEEVPATFGKSGLIWIGEKFYPTPESFADEANIMGVSRRISSIPLGFVIGETWVFFAHRKAVEDMDNPSIEKRHPGIFQAFRPTSIEYVVTGKETEEELERMVKRGIEPVEVTHRHPNINMWEDMGPPEDEPKEFTYPDLVIADLPLRPSAIKILNANGIEKISDLNGKDIDVVLKIKGIGRRSAVALKEYAENPDEYLQKKASK